MEYPNNSVIQGSSPEGGCTRAPVPILVLFLFFFPLSHTLILFISAEKFVEIYYLQLWKKKKQVMCHFSPVRVFLSFLFL